MAKSVALWQAWVSDHILLELIKWKRYPDKLRYSSVFLKYYWWLVTGRRACLGPSPQCCGRLLMSCGVPIMPCWPLTFPSHVCCGATRVLVMLGLVFEHPDYVARHAGLVSGLMHVESCPHVLGHQRYRTLKTFLALILFCILLNCRSLMPVTVLASACKTLWLQLAPAIPSCESATLVRCLDLKYKSLIDRSIWWWIESSSEHQVPHAVHHSAFAAR